MPIESSPKSNKYKALAVSMTILSNHVNMMAVQMCAKSGDDNDVKPDDDQKMGTNTKNPVLTKTVKKEKD